MNIIKHMEAAFLFSLSVAGVASVMADSIPAAQAHPVQSVVSVASNAGIPVVKVTAKRLSAAEKQRMLAEEVRGSRA
jgi:orotate phosphoribosyltransferase-like protein